MLLGKKKATKKEAKEVKKDEEDDKIDGVWPPCPCPTLRPDFHPFLARILPVGVPTLLSLPLV